MTIVRLLVNWLFVMLAPLWIFPVMLVYIVTEIREDDDETMDALVRGKRYFWGGK